MIEIGDVKRRGLQGWRYDLSSRHFNERRHNNQWIYKVIVYLPISLNLLFNFSKQASRPAVVASNVHESYSTLHLFRLFATFNLLGYISEITTPICEIDALTLVSVVLHDAIFSTTTPWDSLHLNHIVTSVTCKWLNC